MRLMRTLAGLGLLGLALLQTIPIHARRDPQQDWRQSQTEHFSIVFPAEAGAAAAVAAATAEEVYPKVKALCGYAPERVVLVLNARRDDANALAQGLFPKIEIHLVPAGDKWEGTLNRLRLESILIHELTHLCYGLRPEGFGALLATVFGEVHALNFVGPAWWEEGVAMYAETALTTGGRGRNPYTAMELAASLLSREPWSLGQVSHAPAFDYPFDRHYIAGYFLTEGLAVATGRADFIDRISRQQSAWPFFGIGFAWEKAVQARLGQLFDAVWEAQTRTARQRHGRKRPAMPGAVRVTADPAARYQQPRWTQENDLVGYRESDDRKPALVRLRWEGRKLETLHTPDLLQGRVGYDPRTSTFYYGRLLPGLVYDDHLMADLFAWNRQGEKRLTWSGRCESPDPHPDGRVACVLNRFVTHGLGVRHPEGAMTRISLPEGATIHALRWSPDGSRLAAAVRINGCQDICLVDVTTGDLTPLTGWDAAGDHDPAWSPDGRYLFFVSDRTQVYQIYAYDLAHPALYQVTDSQMGAFDPDISSDARRIVFAEYCIGNSQQWVVAPLAPSHWKPVAIPEGAQPVAAEAFRTPPLHATPYDAWPHLRPRFWIPYAIADRWGPAWGFMSLGQDPLELHGWQVLAGYQPESGHGYGDVAYINQDLPVKLQVELFHLPLHRLGLPKNLENDTAYWGRKTGGALQLELPLLFSWRHRGGTFMRLAAAYQHYVITQADTAAFPEARFQGASGLVSFGDTEQTARDLFPTQGFAFDLYGRAGWAGYDGRLVSGRVEVIIPSFLEHQAALLAVKASRLEGSFPESITQAAPRGYQGGRFNASQTATLSAGYRMPLWYVDEGPGVWPIFFDALWVEAFGDWGAGWEGSFASPEDGYGHVVWSAGAEFHMEMRWFWSLRSSLVAAVACRQDRIVSLSLGFQSGL